MASPLTMLGRSKYFDGKVIAKYLLFLLRRTYVLFMSKSTLKYQSEVLVLSTPAAIIQNEKTVPKN